MNWLKAHWVWIAAAVVGGYFYLRLSSNIAAVASAQSANAPVTTGGASLGQTPVYAANASGYDNSVSGVSSNPGGTGTDQTSQNLLSVLQLQTAGANATNLLATTGANATATQSVALNSSVTNTLASAFSAFMPTFLQTAESNNQTLSASATPNASGGVDFNVSKNVNLASLPTTAQQSNYVSGAFSNLFAPAAPPKPVDISFANFDASAYGKANPGVLTALTSGQWAVKPKDLASAEYTHYLNFGAKEGRTFTAKTA